jgi:ribonuclease D
MLLENKKIKKIFHAGDQDWEILKQSTGAITWPFIDTQLMAAFATLGHSNSLESLVSKLLEMSIDKSQQNTNWVKRPLTPDQLEYAAQDAAYVAKIYPILNQKLVELGRDTWVTQEMKTLLKKYQCDTSSKDWLKLCATGCKWPTPYYALELSKWREGWAKKLDIPKRHVIADNFLEQALRTKSLSHINENICKPDAFEDLKFLWEKLGREHNQYKKDRSILNQMVKVHHQDFTLAQRKLLKKWQSRSKIIAKQLDIPPHCILNKQQLQLIVSGKKSSISGWRKEFLKEKNFKQ